MKKGLTVFLILCLCFMALPVFGEGQKEVSTEKSGYLVIFSQCNNAEPYRAAQNDSFKALWSQYDDVVFEIQDAQQDNSRQISQIETAIVKNPDLLIVAPNERGPLSAVMGKAKKAGIPVICLERDIVDAENYTTWIMSDNYSIGKLAGEYMVEMLKVKNGAPEGKIVDLRGLLGVEGEQKRFNGAWDVMNTYSGITQEAEAVCNWLQSDARVRMTEILRAHPDIDIVYGHNDPMAVGGYLAARDLGREKDILFVGVDGLQGEAGGIKKVVDGVLAATFTYPLCTDKAVEIGNKIMRDPDFTPEKVYEVQSEMITPSNAVEKFNG
ncbi:MAG: substrate-binding domain-containing protein [Spirochaetales bacterium]|nr:substrate-binding domain-containing protein [Spirochaetales bacterium]